ncbi:5,6-dimethylbenzimidazole synthase [Streptomyces dysideae]|uniref:Nicotinate-nucleotide--dimethylbenzimidazole phosphoribosyltransferase n=1 Tax=Streptomyces dysideae TaxID=909626 RepID=A0A101UX66_9ACTN|nr:nicotinate-nucleotide--dimethylbenzimidazole phosphoribosyltransferase [Streptomyces dysideae]KUO18519.1 5,6-dimethylbenzimidazole synthase [Streptomyces dysideae]
MTDTGQVPGEGLPENAGMVEQPGVPAHGTYTYLSETTAEDEDLLLLPGAQGAWGNEVAPPAPEPVVEAVHEPGPHEMSGRDSGSVDLSGVRLPNPTPPTAPSVPIPPITPRRPLHLGPPIPDASASPVRSLADRGAVGAPVRRPGPEYLDVPQHREAAPRAATPWGAPAPAQVGTEAPAAETVVPTSAQSTEPTGTAQAVATRVATEADTPTPQENVHAGHEPVGGEAAPGAVPVAGVAYGPDGGLTPVAGGELGAGLGPDAGQVPEARDTPGAGSGPDAGQVPGVGQVPVAEVVPGAGPTAGLGLDAGQVPEVEIAPGAGTVAGLGPDAGQVPGVGEVPMAGGGPVAGLGPDADQVPVAGLGPDVGQVQVPGAEPVAGPGPGVGQVPVAGGASVAGLGPEAGQVLEADVVPGGEPVAGLGPDAGQVPVAGGVPGAGAGPDAGQVPGVGQVPVAEVVPGAGPTAELGPDAGQVAVAGDASGAGQVPVAGGGPGAGQTPADGQVLDAGEVPGPGQVQDAGENPGAGHVQGAGGVPVAGQVPGAGEDAVAGTGSDAGGDPVHEGHSEAGQAPATVGVAAAGEMPAAAADAVPAAGVGHTPEAGAAPDAGRGPEPVQAAEAMAVVEGGQVPEAVAAEAMPVAEPSAQAAETPVPETPAPEAAPLPEAVQPAAEPLAPQAAQPAEAPVAEAPAPEAAPASTAPDAAQPADAAAPTEDASTAVTAEPSSQPTTTAEQPAPGQPGIPLQDPQQAQSPAQDVPSQPAPADAEARTVTEAPVPPTEAEAHMADPAAHIPDTLAPHPYVADPAGPQLRSPESTAPAEQIQADATAPLPPGIPPEPHPDQPLGQFVPVEGSVPTTPHLAPTPPQPITLPTEEQAPTVPTPREGDPELVQHAEDLDTRAADQEDPQDQEEMSAAAVEEVRQSTGPAAPGYDDAEREAVLKVMRERRDIRNGFRSDPIPHEVLLRVLEAAHTAPSVGHSQPWDFVVIRSADTRRTMHELAMRQRDAYAKSLPKGRAKQFKELKIEAILDTPVNIVVTADPTRGGRHTLGRHTQPQMAPYSSALAVENLWLAARAEGLGVGWVSFFDEREMVRTLGLPEHLDVVAYLCVGYVDEFPDEPELMQAGWSKRRPLSWVVHEETYGRRALPGEEPHDLLAETVAQIRPLDAKALGEAWERQKRMTKPAGALGMLEIISAQLSGLSRQCPPPIPEPAAVAVFAGDHGVHAQGVTPWPQEVTAQMVANFLGGGAVCNAFASQVGAEVCVVDVGVASDLPATPGLLPRKVRAGTSDMTTGPAMTREEAKQAIEVGIETARDLVAAGNKALLTGEMGIANTTASAALISVFTGADPAEVTGRGTGINDETLARKTEVVRRALELHQPDPADPIGVLAAIGGFEHAAIVGLLLGGASLRTPVILDGVSAGAAALVARAIAPEVLAACIAGHRSAEPGHVAALNKLGLRPLVDLDLRLGEGTGALLALPLVQSTARAMHEVATFDSAGVTEK